MNGLRISLVIVGILIVVGIVLWDRRRRKSQNEDDQWTLPDPLDQMDDESFSSDSDVDELLSDDLSIRGSRNDDLDLGHIEDLMGLRIEESQADISEQVAADDVAPADRQPVTQESVLVLSVIGQNDRQFNGSSLFKAAEAAGFDFDEQKIFHLYPSTDDEKKIPLFSMANILEPGTFNENKKATFRTPGVILFLQLPGPWEGAAAFERMVNTANTLADRLGGKVCDERRTLLSRQRLESMREQAAAYKV